MHEKKASYDSLSYDFVDGFAALTLTLLASDQSLSKE